MVRITFLINKCIELSYVFYSLLHDRLRLVLLYITKESEIVRKSLKETLNVTHIIQKVKHPVKLMYCDYKSW